MGFKTVLYLQLVAIFGFMVIAIAPVSGAEEMNPYERCTALYTISKGLHVGDYFGPELEEVVEQANKVANILELDFSLVSHEQAIIKNTESEEEFEVANDNLWLQLGLIFNKANIFIASTQNRASIPAELGDFNNDMSQPFPFLRHALMCFSSGIGFKNFKPAPSSTDWRLCLSGEDEVHGSACIKLGTEAYKEAVRSLNKIVKGRK